MTTSRETIHDDDARGRRLVFAMSGAALLFGLWLGGGLPPVVASHFGAGGDANGWMTRDQFVGLMGFMLGVLPSLTLWGMTRAMHKRTRLKIPHADWWLAAPRRSATERWLRGHFARFCAGLPVFLAWIFWLVAQANRGAPAHPTLDIGGMLAGLAVFLAATAAWVVILNRHFRR